MVLRSGIIIPFQFRDTKKLLMIGVPEENRDLSIWDLKNVVRAAFGIYNFEFRNKKIGFNIPDELLLHYLAQRHDLTNFVIEIGQANDEENIKDALSFEPSCSLKLGIPVPQKSNESETNESMATPPLSSSASMAQNYTTTPVAAAASMVTVMQRERSPLESLEHNSDQSSNQEPAQKIRISQVYSENAPESMTQSIDPMAIIPKSEHEDADTIADDRDLRFERRQQLLQQHEQQQHQMQQQQLLYQQQQSQHFFANYPHHAMIGSQTSAVAAAAAAAAAATPPPLTTAPASNVSHQHQQQYSPALVNRFRRRGERMSKDQKELYVKYFEENPCMLTQRRNDIVLEPHWNKLASMLNSVPQGAVKNVEEWKQTFDAWRYRVFMYTRYNSKLTGIAAQNPKNYKPLTTTDQRAYAMWTSHKSTAPQEFEKMEMFSNLDETQPDYDY